MKVVIILVLALVAVIHATPYGRGGRYGGYGGAGYGGAGYGGAGYGGAGYGGGSEYGNSGSHRGENGYLDEGYDNYGFDEAHDIRHQENEFDKSIHQHHVSDNNVGGVSSGGRGGHQQSGHGAYESGQNNYGREFGHGYNYGV